MAGAREAAAMLRSTIEYAVLAPSSHNTQPWKFKLRWGGLELVLDRSRALPLIDPACRELTISCGAALQNIRVALRHFGFTAKIHLMPYASTPDVLARIELGPRCTVSHLDERLFAAIPQRHTSRAPFERKAICQRLIAGMQAAAETAGAWMRPCGDDILRPAIAGLVAAGDVMQGNDRKTRREIAAWIHPDDAPDRDGIPGYALGMSPLVSRFASAVMPWIPWGATIARRDQALALDAPVLAVIGTVGDTPRDWMAAGQALQLVLLVAAAHGISASFLNQPLQIPELRTRLGTLLGKSEFPQVIIRMGYAGATRPTPRRDVMEVLTCSPADVAELDTRIHAGCPQ
jgi:nitroreductase